jgi:phosphohistidine swiveling domain-containing protein
MGILRGVGACAGRGAAHGVALVARGTEETVARLLSLPDSAPVVLVLGGAPGQQLDCGVLRRVAGVVMAASGLVSTALTVARELGLPVVAGLGEAVSRIGDGQWVRVDGEAGTVELRVDNLCEVVAR